MMTARILLLLMVVLTSACSSGPPPKLYLLEPVIDPLHEVAAPSINALGLSRVSVPAYAADERIASRAGDRRIAHSDDAKWAESPEDSITRVLADRLRFYLQANVIVEPWPRGYDPQARVEVEFDKLLRDPTGGSEMAGHIRIISGNGRRVLAVRSFQIVRYGNDTDASEFFDATAAAINDIVQMTAESLRGFYPPKK